jgi:hypothetical protein
MRCLPDLRDSQCRASLVRNLRVREVLLRSGLGHAADKFFRAAARADDMRQAQYAVCEGQSHANIIAVDSEGALAP